MFTIVAANYLYPFFRHFYLKCFTFLALGNNTIVKGLLQPHKAMTQHYLYKNLKITLLTLVCILTLCLFFPLPSTHTTHARKLVPAVPDMPFVWIEHPNTMLYNRNNGILQQVTSLPVSYFAHVTGEENDFFSVIFYDLTGLVRKNSVTLVDFEPVTKFATGTVSIVGDIIANIRTRPDTTATIVGEARKGEILTFYGTITGTASGEQNEWLFVRFTNSNGNPTFGYIFNHGTNLLNITNPPLNVIEKVMVYQQDPPTFLPPNIEFPPYLTVVFIVALCIPALIIMILLFKKPKSKAVQKTPRSF